MNFSELSWSTSSADDLSATTIVCSIAISIHVLFWIQTVSFSSLRQLNIYLCYFEASSKFYVNVVQSYFLLAMNVCRCAQIIFNRNVFIENVRLVILSHSLIYILPAINVMIKFLANWTIIWHRAGQSCDTLYVSLPVQICNLFVTYITPVTLNTIIVAFGIRHVSSIKGVRSQQIVNLRRKYKKVLLFQTVILYSIWIVLWSPNIIAFQFINVNTQAGIYTSQFNYIEIAVDPSIVATLDVGFFQSWQIIWRKMKGCRRMAAVPVIPGQKYWHS
ncbi:unnamed protein product [Rotaria magnacalcarata]|uniref:G-protein coupled receptors family 1 profile domain-containing protein n=3 Tax=Rotaria magnacalcarata TaxID=392030 RepID=A0A819UW34_9BILA|nr:unnamed protein product [Rotaria magnacalcarata]CAF2144196.1 unnamed protein product [Rotaria magnacalcarata]CAF4063114.1 unnamed protein product [Rotaria magnacalcarata]CAF4099204.1 unnamed protein product [Rotaria magnacalcarata]